MKEKTIIEHLEELRRRIILYLFSLTLFSIAASAFTKNFLNFLLEKAGHTIFLSLSEGFLVHIKIALFLGFFLSLPVFFYQVWAFISGALREKEAKFLKVFSFISLFLFMAGASFAYFIVLPITIKFFLSYQSPLMHAALSAGQYLNFIGGLVITFGFIFELPLAIVFLTRLRIIGPGFLIQKRKYAVVVIFIVAAILTPPDVLSQFLMAIPLIILYEAGIILSRLFAAKGRLKN